MTNANGSLIVTNGFNVILHALFKEQPDNNTQNAKLQQFSVKSNVERSVSRRRKSSISN